MGNHAEEIHYSEFLAAMMSSRIQLHDDLLKQTFQRFDVNNEGFITKGSLREVLGQVYEGEDIDILVEEADISHDGKIDYDEFIKFLKEDAKEHHHEAAHKLIDHAHKHPDNAHRVPRMKKKMKNGSKNTKGAESSSGDKSKAACCALQ